jgi:hypothetical protein
MKIEVVGYPLKADGYVLEVGDVKTVPDEIGARWCAAGWVKDTAGIVPTGELKVVRVEVKPDSVKHKTQPTAL